MEHLFSLVEASHLEGTIWASHIQSNIGCECQPTQALGFQPPALAFSLTDMGINNTGKKMCAVFAVTQVESLAIFLFVYTRSPSLTL